MRRLQRPLPRKQRGVGALVVVMVLFFIMSMVAAYSSRNMIFEQRTSANNARSTQAFEAAEAGLEWAIAMLNGGRVTDQCTDSANVALDNFRDRHLSMDADGVIVPRKWLDAGAETDFHPSCTFNGNAWDCSCPGNAGPALAAPAGTAPTFRITFEAVPAALPHEPDLIRVYAQGCSGFGTPCVAGAANRADAVADVTAVLGLAQPLTQTPAAALTVRGRLDAPDAVQVANADVTSGGVTINAGEAVVAPNFALSTLPGMPASASMREDDGSLSRDVVPAGGLTRGEMMFLAAFAMPPAAYRVQPAVMKMTCGGGAGCAELLENNAVQFAGRVIWVDGDLTIEDGADITLGIPTKPVLLIVSGNLNIGDGSTFTLNGMLYTRGASWTTGAAADVLVRGAVVAEGLDSPGLDDGSFTINGAPAIVFDTEVINHLKKAQLRNVMDFGSFVRVPGSWRDFR
jgi:Tfp pilus assembly protein PilX